MRRRQYKGTWEEKHYIPVRKYINYHPYNDAQIKELSDRCINVQNMEYDGVITDYRSTAFERYQLQHTLVKE
jgi:hypothetical protein